MATLVGIFNMTHSPFCYMPPEKWNDVRASRSLRADVPVDDVAANRAKAARISLAFTALRARLAAAAPDVLVVFGDDQLESFDFTNFPTFAIYAGETFEGALSNGITAKLSGHPALGQALLTGLMRRGFDPALCLDSPKPERNIGHAFFRPAESLTDLTTAIVPIFVNCYYAPQPTAERCYQLGVAVRDIIAEYPGEAARRGRRLRRPLAHATRDRRLPRRSVRSHAAEPHDRRRRPRHGPPLRRVQDPQGRPQPGRDHAQPQRVGVAGRQRPTERHARSLQLDRRLGRG